MTRKKLETLQCASCGQHAWGVLPKDRNRSPAPCPCCDKTDMVKVELPRNTMCYLGRIDGNRRAQCR